MCIATARRYFLLIAALAAACGGDPPPAPGRDASAGDAGGGPIEDARAGVDGAALDAPATEAASDDVAPADAAAADASSCRGVDLIIVMQATAALKLPGASGTSQWQVAMQTLLAALPRLASAGYGAGIVYLGGSTETPSCDAAAYATPAVAIAPLANNIEALSQSLMVRAPTGSTPLQQGLQGGLAYAVQWAQTNPDKEVMALLVTNGTPTACNGTIDGTAVVAAAAASASPSVRTAVAGVGANAPGPDQIARAGGTEAAISLEVADPVSALVTKLAGLRLCL